MRKYKRALLIGLIAAAASLLLLGGTVLIKNAMTGGLLSQYTAERWKSTAKHKTVSPEEKPEAEDGEDTGDEEEAAEKTQLRYAQISFFVAENAALSPERVSYIEEGVAEALTADSYEAPEGARLFLTNGYGEIDAAFSAVSEAKDGTAVSTKLCCTGSDFFTFHPHDFVSGWYYTADVMAEPVVVVNEQLAFRLYGSINVTGKELTLFGHRVSIIGVTSGPTSKKERARWAGNDDPVAYLPAEFLEQLGISCGFTSFELLLPNPVKDYAKKLAEAQIGIDPSQYELVENTGRYSLKNTVTRLFSAGDRVMKTSAVYYPFWENAARRTDRSCGPAAVAIILFTAIPALYLLFVLGILFFNKEKLIKAGAAAVSKKASEINLRPQLHRPKKGRGKKNRAGKDGAGGDPAVGNSGVDNDPAGGYNKTG